MNRQLTGPSPSMLTYVPLFAKGATADKILTDLLVEVEKVKEGESDAFKQQCRDFGVAPVDWSMQAANFLQYLNESFGEVWSKAQLPNIVRLLPDVEKRRALLVQSELLLPEGKAVSAGWGLGSLVFGAAGGVSSLVRGVSRHAAAIGAGIAKEAGKLDEHIARKLEEAHNRGAKKEQEQAVAKVRSMAEKRAAEALARSEDLVATTEHENMLHDKLTPVYFEAYEPVSAVEIAEQIAAEASSGEGAALEAAALWSAHPDEQAGLERARLWVEGLCDKSGELVLKAWWVRISQPAGMLARRRGDAVPGPARVLVLSSFAIYLVPFDAATGKLGAVSRVALSGVLNVEAPTHAGAGLALLGDPESEAMVESEAKAVGFVREDEFWWSARIYARSADEDAGAGEGAPVAAAPSAGEEEAKEMGAPAVDAQPTAAAAGPACPAQLAQVEAQLLATLRRVHRKFITPPAAVETISTEQLSAFRTEYNPAAAAAAATAAAAAASTAASATSASSDPVQGGDAAAAPGLFTAAEAPAEPVPAPAAPGLDPFGLANPDAEAAATAAIEREETDATAAASAAAATAAAAAATASEFAPAAVEEADADVAAAAAAAATPAAAGADADADACVGADDVDASTAEPVAAAAASEPEASTAPAGGLPSFALDEPDQTTADADDGITKQA